MRVDGCWKLNSGLLDEQLALLSTELSPQPNLQLFSKDVDNHFHLEPFVALNKIAKQVKIERYVVLHSAEL